MKYNLRYDVIVSTDQAGILEYWTGAKTDYIFPSKIVSFESKLDTGKFNEQKNRFLTSSQTMVTSFLSVFFFFFTIGDSISIDLYEFAKNKTIVTGLSFSPDGKRFATLSTDRKVRVFTFLTGKLIRVFDETLARYQEIQHSKHALPNMEFGRK